MSPIYYGLANFGPDDLMVDEVEAGKRAKSSVDYSKGHEDHCGVCRFFVAPDACKKVAGKIRADYWCKLFKRKK